MSQTPSDEQQWHQPAWDSSSADSISDPRPAELTPVSGEVLVPARRSVPSALESTLTVIVSAIWPVAVVGALLGFGSWWWNIGIAIVASSVIGAINSELAKRRKAG
ncbi:hypothetical protein [Propionicimonas paludicola]|uniref:hypothetical protein n=1 Tax=Propionicimonas paludicola TaxID=185243 RepID=UPI000BF6A147|nr:hypothetical protein [Propionicimonas paludicola]